VGMMPGNVGGRKEEGESNGVGKDHQSVPRLGALCQSEPWDMLEKLTKEEFLKKGRAEESRARGRGDDDESDDEDRWLLEDDALAFPSDEEDGGDEGDWQEHAPSEHDSDDSDEDDSDEDPDSDDEEVVAFTRKRRRQLLSLIPWKSREALAAEHFRG